MAEKQRTAEALTLAEARATAAEERLRSQTVLLAEAEHRLKTALALITGWAATLDERWDDLEESRRREAVAIIRRTADGLAEHSRDLLSDARAEIRLLDLAPVELDLREVLERDVTAFRGLSQRHAITHVTDADADVVVRADPGALHQVLGHLLENAVKYSPNPSTVTVAAHRDGDDVVIDVRDEGVGVPTDLDVFAPFQRGDASVEGTGLGLYIVRNLVRAMGGDVTASRNADGPGSTFSIRLPA